MPVNRLLCGSLDHSSDRVRERYGANIIKTRDLICEQLPSVKEEREALQKAGEKLDRADGGAWVKNALVRFIEDNVQGSTASGFFVVDSVRISGQVYAVRQAYGTAVHHIHLDASDAELASRYAARGSRTKEFARYADARKSKTERNVGRLSALADTVVATDRCTPEAVQVRAIALLGPYPRSTVPLVDVLVGGQYGSEEALKRLNQGRVRDVALQLVELARSKEAARRGTSALRANDGV